MASTQSVPGISSWAFWPVGDRYSLTPKWEETHTDTDNTVRPDDEKNRLALVGDYGASEIWFTIQLRDMTDPKNPAVPAEEPSVVTAVIDRIDGWLDDRPVPATLVMEPPPVPEGGYVPGDPEPVPIWNGDIRFDINDELKAWIMDGMQVRMTIDAEFPADVPERVRIGYGTLVLRR